MSASRVVGLALGVADVAFAWWGMAVTATDFGSDFAVNPGNRVLVLLVGGVLGLISLILIVGVGPSRFARD